VFTWLKTGWSDLQTNLVSSLLYGAALVAVGWGITAFLVLADMGWMILPSAAGAVLLGPAVTVHLYRISRRRAGLGGGGIAAPGQVFLVSVVMMVLSLMWLRSATLLFAVFFGLHPFPGFLDTMSTLLSTPRGLALVTVGSLVGGLFAAFGFAISAFSFPMLVHRNIDGFSAMALSFDAVLRNFRLAVIWGGAITCLIALSLATGLLGLTLVFPLLGYATWHGYADLFESNDDAE
jgi:uncharacterized membrane protein